MSVANVLILQGWFASSGDPPSFVPPVCDDDMTSGYEIPSAVFSGQLVGAPENSAARQAADQSLSIQRL